MVLILPQQSKYETQIKKEKSVKYNFPCNVLFNVKIYYRDHFTTLVLDCKFNYGSTHGYTERNDLEKRNNIKEIQTMPELPEA